MAQASQTATVDRLPDHMQSAARAYIEEGRKPGGFLTKVLSNDLVGAVGRADEANLAAIKDWTLWLYNDIPSGAWGDRATVREWCESGGLQG